MNLISQLDTRLSEFSTKLRDDLGIEPPSSLKLATTIYNDVHALLVEQLPTLASESPLSLKDRHNELLAVIDWWSKQATEKCNCGIIMTLNYFCFVYLSESCFKVLREKLPSDSITRKCCKYLTDNPVRAFGMPSPMATGELRWINPPSIFGRGKALRKTSQYHGSGSQSMT